MDQEVRASKILLRVLNARERRRFDTFRMLPLDAVQPSLRRRVINDFDVQLYKYETDSEALISGSEDMRRMKKSGSGRDDPTRRTGPEMIEIKIDVSESETISEGS